MSGKLPPVFFEMLQSFVAMAENLNLSHAVSKLNTSRQTIRRHLNSLELLRDEKLFTFKDRKYELTAAGQQAYSESLYILESAQDWVCGRRNHTNGLDSRIVAPESELPFLAQRHPVLSIWSMGPPLLKKGLQSWQAAECQIEHSKFKKIKPYLVVYRRHGSDWICAEVGDKSSYATWLGWSWAKSAIGSSFDRDPISSVSDNFMIGAYDAVARTGGVWYDHISTKFPRAENGELSTVNYQRLLLACLFPDGEPAVVSLVARTNRIQIEGIEPQLIPVMAEADTMDFEI